MYKLHLILKYLLKRRIAWVSLLAVILCTAMVLVVISVMGGWLRMFEQSFHGLTGDIIVVGQSGLTGFPHYQEMVDQIERLPDVEGAMPVISTFGLINIANIKSEGVQVIGIPIEKVSRVNEFPDSLHLQHKALLDEAALPGASPSRKRMLEKLAALPPSFDLRTAALAPIDPLPGDFKIPPAYEDRLSYDASKKCLQFAGQMTPAERDDLLALSADATYREAVQFLYERSQTEVVDYRMELPRVRVDVTKWPGMIPGAGVLDIRKDAKGGVVGRTARLYRLPVKLALLGMGPGGRMSFDMSNKAEPNYWIVDDSRTGISISDSNTVYVPFLELQKDLGMGPRPGKDLRTGQDITEPARATDIHVKVRAGVDLAKAKVEIQQIVDRVAAQFEGGSTLLSLDETPRVVTWREDKGEYLRAIEKEKLLVTLLFGIISLVAVFLIFCIFYMIVVEKTRDIGIIKSVGATAQGVAGIFLGYGLAIGLVGAGMGFAVAFVITRYINEIHSWLGRVLKFQMWDPNVYLFDRIPSTMNPTEVAIILAVAIASAILGALVPAIRAARMNPVEALRWE